jgi:D-methionine transport system ATP-binding protein
MESGEVVEQGNVLEVFKHPKQAITKRFVKQVTEPEETNEVVAHLLELYPKGKVIQLSFVGDSAEQPLMTNLIRQFSIEVNILQGKISQTQSGSYGSLFIHLDGDEQELNRALEYIYNQHVEVEVIANA